MIPNKFTFTHLSTTYLAEKLDHDAVKISWPLIYHGDPGSNIWSLLEVEKRVAEGTWVIDKNLDPTPVLTTEEKCQKLGLFVSYHGDHISLSHCSVNNRDAYVKLIDLLYDARTDDKR